MSAGRNPRIDEFRRRVAWDDHLDLKEHESDRNRTYVRDTSAQIGIAPGAEEPDLFSVFSLLTLPVHKRPYGGQDT